VCSSESQEKRSTLKGRGKDPSKSETKTVVELVYSEGVRIQGITVR